VGERLGAGVAALLADPSARATYEFNCQVMAMRTDVCLDLDLSSGPGVLPLNPERVAAVFAAHQLMWTAPLALCVLCDADPATVAPAEPVMPLPLFESWGGGGSRRLPRLEPRKPAMAQLSLFD
jgi:DNA polymerase-1